MNLINGEAVEQLKLIPDKSVDFVCIDPPYELDNHGGGKTDFAQRKLVKDLHIDFISNGFEMEKVFTEIERVSKTMNMICFCSNKQVSKIMNYWEQKKYSVTLLVWQKSNPVPFGNGKYISDLEFMIYVRGKKAIYNNTGYKNQLKVFNYPAPSSKARIHPTEKPIELLKRLIEIHSNEGSVVLDCYGGSFSTGLACMELGREFIGIEIDEEIFNSAKKRVEEKMKESKEMREQIDRVKNWKQLLNEQQTTTPKVLTLNSHQFSQLVKNTDYSDGYFKDDTIENRIKYFNITNISDSTPASFENAYYIVLLIGDKIIGVAKVDYYSKPTSIIRFFSIDKEYRGCGYSRLMADALFNEAKNRNKNITTSLYTQLGKTHLQHLFNEYAKKHGVKFIDRKESDPLYQY